MSHLQKFGCITAAAGFVAVATVPTASADNEKKSTASTGFFSPTIVAGLFAIPVCASAYYWYKGNSLVDSTSSSSSSVPYQGEAANRLSRWITNWNAGRYSKADQSFHRSTVNPHLLTFEHLLYGGKKVGGRERVLVPLCGKSVDLVHLAMRGNDVLGVEAVPRAVEEFSKENSLPMTNGKTVKNGMILRELITPMPSVLPTGQYSGHKIGYFYGQTNGIAPSSASLPTGWRKFTDKKSGHPYFVSPEGKSTWMNPNKMIRTGYIADRPAHLFGANEKRWPRPGHLAIALGDFFTFDKCIFPVENAHVERSDLKDGEFSAVWDRAALIALQPVNRKRYVETVSKSLVKGGRCLLVVAEHDSKETTGRAGPPFSVSEEDVKELYGKDFTIELLARVEKIDDPQDTKWKEKGLTYFNELCFLLKKK
eukprot:g4407.t1